MSKFTDRLQKQMNRNNAGIEVSKVLKTKNGTSRTKFSLGDPVIVSTGGADTPAEIVRGYKEPLAKNAPKFEHKLGSDKPYYWLLQDSYLCRFENGTEQYIPAKYIRLNWKEKQNKSPTLNMFGEVQDNLSNGEIIRLI